NSMTRCRPSGESNMKSHRFMLTAVLISLYTAALAQSDTQKTIDKLVVSDAQKSFTQLKTPAGAWQGSATADPPMQAMADGPLTQITVRVACRGNALVHEMKELGKPDDPTRYDHPVTMLYMDADRLYLTHYCDAGNRPRLVARTSPDGKTVEFDFLDLSGGNQYGHMFHAVFTIIDANHHIDARTSMMPATNPTRP